jgi:hypothetical protein
VDPNGQPTDAPVFRARRLLDRPSERLAAQPPPAIADALSGGDVDAVEDAVAFTLAFPITDRPAPSDPDTTMPDALPIAALRFPDSEDTSVDLPPVSDPTTIERDPYRSAEETTLHAGERDNLERVLASIGPLDDGPDLDVDRSAAARVLLARARAIRFRLAVLDVWGDDGEAIAPADDRLELAIHPAITVAFANGWPTGRPAAAGHDDPLLAGALAEAVRAADRSVSRATFREVGSAACARVTLLGTRRAASYLRARFGEAPAAERRSAIALATKIAGLGAPHPARATALALVVDALGAR